MNQQGFKTIISTVNFTTHDDVNNGVPGDFPSSEEELMVCRDLGMQAVYYDAAWTTEWVETISQAIHTLPKPVLIHCHAGYHGEY